MATVIGLIVVAVSHWTLAAETKELDAPKLEQANSEESSTPAEAKRRFWERPDPYHASIGIRGSFGESDFNPAGTVVLEGYARYQWAYGLGVQGSYLHFEVGNSDSEGRLFRTNALTLGPTWHPLRGFWIDPFAEAHLVTLVGPIRGYPGIEYGRLGAEGILGLQIASRYLAGGLHLRYGSTTARTGEPTTPSEHAGEPVAASWLLLGVQLEARL